MIKKILKKFRNIDNNYIYIFLIALILVMPLISKKYLYGHDVLYHISNIETIKNDLLNFNFSPISSFIANNFGYGGAIFYPKLPHVFSAIISIPLSIVGMSGIYAMKISQIIVVFLSAIFMYRLLLSMLKDKNIALLGSIFYITMPYFMTNIYVRSSFNETFVFLFIPIIFQGLVYLFKNEYNKFYLYFILGYLGMMNSHLVLSVYFTILIGIILLVNIKTTLKKEYLTKLLKASLLILIFQLPIVIQMIEHKTLGIYAVFNPKIMWSNATYVLSKTLNIKDFIIPIINPNSNIYTFINILLIIFSILGIINIFKEKDKKIIKVIEGVLLFTIISIWLCTKYFPYNYLPSILLSIQFAFRNLSFAGFGLSILGAYGLSSFSNNIKSGITKFVIITSCLIVIPFINNTEFIPVNSMGYDTYAGMGFQKEYLTMNAHKNIEYFKTRDDSIKILSDDEEVEINVLENNTPKLKFEVKDINDTVTLELPRLYYLGYDITLTTEKEKIKLDYTNDKYGFIKIKVPENGTVNVKYTGTTLYKITLIISILTIVTLIILSIKKVKNKNTK